MVNIRCYYLCIVKVTQGFSVLFFLLLVLNYFKIKRHIYWVPALVLGAGDSGRNVTTSHPGAAHPVIEFCVTEFLADCFCTRTLESDSLFESLLCHFLAVGLCVALSSI